MFYGKSFIFIIAILYSTIVLPSRGPNRHGFNNAPAAAKATDLASMSVAQKLAFNKQLDANPQYSTTKEEIYPNRNLQPTLNTSIPTQDVAQASADIDVPEDDEEINTYDSTDKSCHPVELVFKGAGISIRDDMRDPNVKILVRKGSFPYGAQGPVGDIIINDAMPDLLGCINPNGSSIDKRILALTSQGYLAAQKGEIKIDPSAKIAGAVQEQIYELIYLEKLTHTQGEFQLANDVPGDLKALILKLIEDEFMYAEQDNLTYETTADNHPLITQIKKIKTDNGIEQFALGQVVATEFLSNNKPYYVIHAVVPHESTPDREAKLQALVSNVLHKAFDIQKNCNRPIEYIAFPSLATHFGYPINEAAAIIVKEIGDEMQAKNFPMTEVQFVLDSDHEFVAYQRALCTYAQQAMEKSSNIVLNYVKEETELDERMFKPVLRRVVIKSYDHSNPIRNVKFALHDHIVNDRSVEEIQSKAIFPEAVKKLTFWQMAKEVISSPFGNEPVLQTVKSAWKSWQNSDTDDSDKNVENFNGEQPSFAKRHFTTMLGGVTAMSLWGLSKLFS